MWEYAYVERLEVKSKVVLRQGFSHQAEGFVSRYEKRGEDLLTLLRDLGNDGWEMVSHGKTGLRDDIGEDWWFKRLLQ